MINRFNPKSLYLNKEGLTLIELIITLSIISIIILVVTQVYVMGMVQSKSDMKKAKIQAEGRTALEGITKNIKLASRIEATYGGYTSDTTNIILNIPAIDSSENFIYSGETRVNDHVTYSLVGKNLHKVISSPNVSSRLYSQDGTDSIILSNVKSLSFSYNPAIPNTTLVSVNITLEDTTQKVPIEINLNANGRPRNVQ